MNRMFVRFSDHILMTVQNWVGASSQKRNFGGFSIFLMLFDMLVAQVMDSCFRVISGEYTDSTNMFLRFLATELWTVRNYEKIQK